MSKKPTYEELEKRIRELERAESDHKQVEKALHENQKRLVEAQSLTHTGNWEWDLQKQKLTWSDEIYRIFGVNPGEFQPSPEAFEKAIHPDDREEFLRLRVDCHAFIPRECHAVLPMQYKGGPGSFYHQA